MQCLSAMIQYITVQYCTAQYSKVQYCTVQYSTVQYHRVQFSKVKVESRQREEWRIGVRRGGREEERGEGTSQNWRRKRAPYKERLWAFIFDYLILTRLLYVINCFWVYYIVGPPGAHSSKPVLNMVLLKTVLRKFININDQTGLATSHLIIGTVQYSTA